MYKKHVQIDRCLSPMGCMPWIIVVLRGLLCVNYVGCRGNKITWRKWEAAPVVRTWFSIYASNLIAWQCYINWQKIDWKQIAHSFSNKIIAAETDWVKDAFIQFYYIALLEFTIRHCLPLDSVLFSLILSTSYFIKKYVTAVHSWNVNYIWNLKGINI